VKEHLFGMHFATICCLLSMASGYGVARSSPRTAITMFERPSAAHAKQCSVYLQNDDFNMREYVARVLMMVCEVSSSEATAIMMEANRDRWRNMALCGTWEEPVARHIHACLEKAGLSVVITPAAADDDENGAADQGELVISETYLDGTPIESEDDLPRYYQ
jgi:ATP-dependent Clp protease adapter protein ClpS